LSDEGKAGWSVALLPKRRRAGIGGPQLQDDMGRVGDPFRRGASVRNKKPAWWPVNGSPG